MTHCHIYGYLWCRASRCFQPDIFDDSHLSPRSSRLEHWYGKPRIRSHLAQHGGEASGFILKIVSLCWDFACIYLEEFSKIYVCTDLFTVYIYIYIYICRHIQIDSETNVQHIHSVWFIIWSKCRACCIYIYIACK